MSRLSVMTFLFLFSVQQANIVAQKAQMFKKKHGPEGGAYRSEDMIKNVMSDMRHTPAEEASASFWYEKAFADIGRKLGHQRNENQAKNLIMFLGDGMPITTVTAARILKGQLKGNPGEEEVLSFEKFPYVGLSKTYCTNSQVADSACSATAYFCGVKANALTIGVTANLAARNCSASMRRENQVSSIAEWAQRAGKSVGIITKTPVTHASPAGAYAHVAHREWQCDADIKDSVEGKESCWDIALQLVAQKPGKDFEVVMGGGYGKFIPDSMPDPFGSPGQRHDERNLIKDWQQEHPKGAVVTNINELADLDLNKVSHIMGLFASNSMSYRCKADKSEQPTLVQMMTVALKKLSQNPNGFFLFVEGGLIDYGNHETKATLSLDETLELEEAVEEAREATSSEDTLIVVTSDHGHALSFAGYPKRGNPIVGLNPINSDRDGVSYMTLNYAVGPRQYLKSNGKRFSLAGAANSIDFVYPSYIKAKLGVHSGEDVAIYASGPFEHLFSGVMEQSLIPHLMAYAACIGNGPTMCQEQ